MQRSNVDLEVHNINFPTRVINWKTLTTSLSWLYIYHQLGSKMHFQVPLNQPHYFQSEEYRFAWNIREYYTWGHFCDKKTILYGLNNS